jgi:hypothetical protein
MANDEKGRITVRIPEHLKGGWGTHCQTRLRKNF